MKKKLFIVLLMLISSAIHAATYYVSNAGNDSNSGLTTSLAWQTLTKVNATTFLAGDNILFQKGGTWIGSITISRSGSSGNPITFGAYGTGANPIITGFTTVTAWTNLGSNIWESTSAASSLDSCSMVTINGVNTPMGRYPNTGYLTYQSYSGNTSITSSSLNSATTNWTGAEVVIKKYRWIIDRNPITGHSGGTLTYTPSSYYYGINDWGFFIQNDARTLDQQNEWFFNHSTKKLQVYSTSQPSGVQLATVDTLFNINEHGYITVDGISFTGSNKAAIFIKNSRNVTITNCTFDFSGTDAVRGINWGNSTYFTLNNCTINHSNNNGLFIESTYDYATIINNRIYNSGMIAGAGGSGDNMYCAILMTSLTNSLIQHNRIINTGYMGIGLMGYSNGSCDNTTITNNIVDNFCIVKDDGGGIYTHTQGYGKVISYNIVLNGIGNNDGTADNYGVQAFGIYLDRNQSTSGVTVFKNTIANISNAGIFLNGTHDNPVTWNTVFNCGISSIKLSEGNSGDVNSGNSFGNNIFCAKEATQLSYYGAESTALFSSYTSDNNYFIRPISDNDVFRFRIDSPWSETDYTLTEWKSYSSQDANSHASPFTITNVNELQLVYNDATTSQDIALTGAWKDLSGNVSYPSITLQPYTSKILFSTSIPASRIKGISAGSGKAWGIGGIAYGL